MRQGFFSSETCRSIYNPDKHDIMIGFILIGNKWSVSLRSAKEEVDVSLIAKRKGGGGHKGAAGFEVKTFEEIWT
jgi:nanoRNase/pAp phosphatase (c-di-AMP/oligoRNAs hydrolase)